jgi:hypothetical protein
MDDKVGDQNIYCLVRDQATCGNPGGKGCHLVQKFAKVMEADFHIFGCSVEISRVRMGVGRIRHLPEAASLLAQQAGRVISTSYK